MIKQKWLAFVGLFVLVSYLFVPTSIAALLNLVWQIPSRAKTGPEGQIREFVIPGVAEASPHDSIVDQQGNLWVTLQDANQMARFKPQTSEWKLFSVPTPNSKPHGLASDAEGNIWFTESGANKIGRLDARTEVISEFAIPSAEDVHTPAFDANGTLWFTIADTNAIGRLDPRSGEIRTFPISTPKAIPNTIALGSDGAMWFCEFGTNRLGRMDPKTNAITEFVIPDAQERPRRMVISGHAVYFTDFGGRLGRFDIDTRSFQSWPSPSGKGAQPYGIGADGEGKIWYYEAGPNKLIRFDPLTEKLDSFVMPTEKSGVVSMTRDTRGNVWMALSGTNKIAVVE